MSRHQPDLRPSGAAAPPGDSKCQGLAGFAGAKRHGLRSISTLSAQLTRAQSGQVWMIQFDPDEFSADAFAQHDILFPAVVAASVRERQAEFFFGRLCARLAMEDVGLPGHQLDIGSMREPRWPLPCLGSITHSKGVAAAIVLPRNAASGVGLDIEQTVSLETLNEVRASVVQPDEWHALASGVPHARHGVLFAAVFSAKESFFKAACAHVGRYFEFHSVEALACGVDEGWINLRVREDLSARFRAGSIWPISVRPVSDDTLMTLATLPAA